MTLGVKRLGVPYWSWFAGSVGQCKWIHGDEDAIVHGVSKFKFVDVKEMMLQELLKTIATSTTSASHPWLHHGPQS
jgi:hypothetical protein